MASLFCCSHIEPYRPRTLDHESKFQNFMRWAQTDGQVKNETRTIPSQVMAQSPYAVQLVCQVNYGPLDWIRYFVPEVVAGFHETSESDLVKANFQKVNTYKNFRCSAHNKFFEINIYQKDPVNRHHWRSTLARPATQIDLPKSVSTAHKNVTELTYAAKPDETTGIQSVKCCLQIALEPLREKFTGGLLYLTVFDLLSDRFNAKIDLAAAWEENLIPLQIVSFILELKCRDDGQNSPFLFDAEKVKQSLLHAAYNVIESRVTGPKRSRHDLLNILRLMATEIALDRCSLDLLQACIEFTEFGPRENITPGLRTSSRQSLKVEASPTPDSPMSEIRTSNLRRTISEYDDNDRDFYKDYAACSLEDCGYCGHCDY